MTDILRVVSIVSWLLPVVWFAPATFRYFTKRRAPNDASLAAVWFVAAVSIGFAARWIVFPHVGAMRVDEVSTWNGLYSLSALSAQFLTWTARFDR